MVPSPNNPVRARDADVMGRSCMSGLVKASLTAFAPETSTTDCENGPRKTPTMSPYAFLKLSIKSKE